MLFTRRPMTIIMTNEFFFSNFSQAKIIQQMKSMLFYFYLKENNNLITYSTFPFGFNPYATFTTRSKTNSVTKANCI